MITTPLLRLTINCPKHGDNHYEAGACDGCAFALHLRQRTGVINAETEKLIKELNQMLREGKLVVVDYGGQFMRGA